MSALTGKPLKGLHSFALMLLAKGNCCVNNISDDFRIIGKEKDRYSFDKTSGKYIYKL